MIQAVPENLKAMCLSCEQFMGDKHDYSFCDKCIGYQFYLALKETSLRLGWELSPERMGQ